MKLDIVVRDKDVSLSIVKILSKKFPHCVLVKVYLVIVYLIVKLDIVVRNEEVSWFLVKTLLKKYPFETLWVLVKDM